MSDYLPLSQEDVVSVLESLRRHPSTWITITDSKGEGAYVVYYAPGGTEGATAYLVE